VAGGIGCSILPEFVCAEALADGRIAQLYPVADLIAPEPWYLCFRQGESTRPLVAQLLESFAAVPV
jgi:DNA-binding transcriptional LysR family regulator